MKKIIDILGILLPALILLLGMIRLFTKKRKGHNALTMFFAFLLLLVGLIRFVFFAGSGRSGDSDPKQVPIPVSKHSAAFNQSLENVLNAYYKMTDGFINNDTTAINQSGIVLKTAIDSFKVDELKKDSLIYVTALQPLENIKSEIVSILSDPSMDEKKGSLNIFSNELFNLVNTVHYDLAKLYWLECPSAFGEDRPGNWLSRDEKSANPYGQKDCAEIRTKINFVQDTTKKLN
jgi:hypothetical protein